MDYDLEIERAIKEIRAHKPRSVIIQLPEGLKPKAGEIYNRIRAECGNVYVWLGSCYGACDTPDAEADMVIQWGHSEWKA